MPNDLDDIYKELEKVEEDTKEETKEETNKSSAVKEESLTVKKDGESDFLDKKVDDKKVDDKKADDKKVDEVKVEKEEKVISKTDKLDAKEDKPTNKEFELPKVPLKNLQNERRKRQDLEKKLSELNLKYANLEKQNKWAVTQAENNGIEVGEAPTNISKEVLKAVADGDSDAIRDALQILDNKAPENNEAPADDNLTVNRQIDDALDQTGLSEWRDLAESNNEFKELWKGFVKVEGNLRGDFKTLEERFTKAKEVYLESLNSNKKETENHLSLNEAGDNLKEQSLVDKFANLSASEHNRQYNLLTSAQQRELMESI